MNLQRYFIFSLIFLISVNPLSAEQREEIIEDFESGTIDLTSYPGEDIEPDAWEITDENTVSPSSQYSLKLFGNTWKVKTISPISVDSSEVWQISTFVSDKGEIHGFGVSDGENVLFYSLDGTQELNIEEWVTVYQGAFPEGEWNQFLLPIAEDWFAWFDELPAITELIFVNDNDESTGIVYFDNIFDVSADLPIIPQVEINYTIGNEYRDRGFRSVDVQFFSEVIDPDSDEHSYFWNFGDGNTSLLMHPIHTFIVEDDHSYTVHLSVTDDTDCTGFTSCQIEVDEGESSFPLTINFAGDIMLARKYEDPGGIIQTFGVESIFEPTLPIFGNNADISVANLECVFTTHDEPHPTKTIYFKSAPANISGISFAGIDLVCLANNHVLDYMLPGMQETQSLLNDHNVLYSGAGADSYEAYQPLFYSKKGMNLAFLRSCDRTGQYNNYQPYLNAGYNKSGFAYMTPYYVLQQIQDVQDIADLIVVETHAGSEYSTEPGANYDQAAIFDGWDIKDFSQDEDYTPRIDIPHMWDIEIRHHFIDSGADLVICHHPHVIQGFEMHNGKLIAHSLGNFVFDLDYLETFPSMILKTKINNDGFFGYSVKPVFIDDYIPQVATGALGNHILDYLAMKSKEMNTYLYIDRLNNKATVITDTLSMSIKTKQFEETLYFQQQNSQYVSQIIHLPKTANISSIDQIYPNGNYEFRMGRELIWFGNYEDEGSTEWNVNSNNEWLDETTFWEGERSLCIHQNANNGFNIITNLENRLIRRSEGKYSVHGWIKTQNGSNVTIQARFYEYRSSGGLLGMDNCGIVSGDADWQYYAREIDVPDATNFFDICANSDPPNSGDSYSWFDKIGLIEWEDWQAGQNFPEPVINPNDYYYLQIRTTEPLEIGNIEFTETNYGEFLVSSSDNIVSSPTIADLHQNYPNPFNPNTTISFSLHKAGKVKLNVFNIKGQRVQNLIDEKYQAGNWSIEWNGKDKFDNNVASGIYFFQLKVDEKFNAAKKGLLLK